MTRQFVSGGYTPFSERDFKVLDPALSPEWENQNVVWVHRDAKKLPRRSQDYVPKM